MRLYLTAVGLAAVSLFSFSCQSISGGRKGDASSIVGTWLVKSPEAPFPYHMFVFHSDGTMLQSNPDVGDPNTSDSNGLGVWVLEVGRIRGKFVEVMADRSTRRFVSRGEISFSITVNGANFHGTASAVFFDAEGRRLRGPLIATLEGQRVTP